jgi:hypothetical protein
MKTDEAGSKRGYLSNKRSVTSLNTVSVGQTETGSELEALLEARMWKMTTEKYTGEKENKQFGKVKKE